MQIQEEIRIKSFNPYENRFPDRKVISSEALILIKHLRISGVKVVILPNDDRPIEYLFKKGFLDIFKDPVIMFFTGIALPVAANLITNAFQKLIDGKKNQPNITINYQNCVIVNNATKEVYSKDCKRIDSKNLELVKKLAKKKEEKFKKSFSIISPYSNLPTPIFLEHTPKIVGWSKISFELQRIKAQSKITDKKTLQNIQSGILKGMSVTGIAQKIRCSICNEDYIKCNHISGEIYDSQMCINNIEKTEFVEASIVQEPINPECLIHLKSDETN